MVKQAEEERPGVAEPDEEPLYAPEPEKEKEKVPEKV